MAIDMQKHNAEVVEERTKLTSQIDDLSKLARGKQDENPASIRMRMSHLA